MSSSVHSKVSWCGAKISYNRAVASVNLGVILGVYFGEYLFSYSIDCTYIYDEISEM